MPHLNLRVLSNSLERLISRLYDIYIECQNLSIADNLLSEIHYLSDLLEEVTDLIELQKK